MKLIFDGPKYLSPLIDGTDFRSFAIFDNDPEKLLKVLMDSVVVDVDSERPQNVPRNHAVVVIAAAIFHLDDALLGELLGAEVGDGVDQRLTIRVRGIIF